MHGIYIQILAFILFHIIIRGFLGGSVAKNLPDNAGDVSSIPGLGRSGFPRGIGSRTLRDIWSNRQVWPWSAEAGQRLTKFCQRVHWS